MINMKNRQHKFLKEAYDIAMNEGVFDKIKSGAKKLKDKFKKDKQTFDDSKTYSKDDIIGKVKKMSQLGAIKFIADEMKLKPEEVLMNNAKDIAANTIKKMGSAVADFGKELKGTFDRNKEDQTNDMDMSGLEIDERKTKFSCIFDKEDGDKILEVASKFDNALKEAPKTAQKIVDQTAEDLKKAGVDNISKEQIEKNTTAILGTLDNTKAKGEKLEDKIETAIEKTTSNANDKKDDSEQKSDSKDDNDINSKLKAFDKELTSKLQKDYKSSLLTGVYTKDELKKFISEKKLQKIDLNKIKTNDAVCARIDFFGDESANILGEVVDDKAGYDIREVTENDKDESIKKIFGVFKKSIQMSFKNSGNVIAYLKYWHGKNDDGNFDTLFVFSELAESTNESLVSEGNMLGKVFNTFAGLIGQEAGTKTSDIEHYRFLGGQLINNINGDGTGEYKFIHFSGHDKETSQFESYGKIPGGLWWLPIAMLGKIALEQRNNIIKAVGNTYLKYKDKKGVIAQMDFYIKKEKYSLRYTTDGFKWICVNAKDAKKNVKDDVLKAALTSETGKKFKQECISIWSKLFKAEEGKAAPFKIVLDNKDQIGLKGKELDQLKTLADNFSKIENDFSSSANESIVVEKLKMPTKEELGKMILDFVKNRAIDKAIQTLNKLSAGKFNDAVIDVYDEQIASKYNDDDLKKTAKKIFDTHPEVAKAEQKDANDKELDRRDDDNISTDIDEKTYKFSCMFEGDVGKQLREILINMNKDSLDATKKVEKAQDETVKQLKKAGVDEKDAKQFGPAAAAMLDAGKKPDEIKKEIDKAKSEVKESCNECLKRLYKHKLISESMQDTRKLKQLKQQIVIEALAYKNRQYITEGFLTSLFGKTVDLSDGKITGETFWTKGDKVGQQAADKIFDMLANDKVDNSNAEAVFKSILKTGNASANATWHTKVTGPAIQSANIITSWAPLIAAAVIGVSYKYRKQINNAIQKGMNKFKNSKGVIAQVGFKTTGKDTDYKTFFNIKDFVWRCMNMTNNLHQPSEELLKASLDSDLGKKFREYCKKTWEPIFNSYENDQLAINFSEIIKDPEKYGLDKKVCAGLKDFVDNWKKIETDCLSDQYKFDIKLK